MKHDLTCSRCGNFETLPLNGGNDWDEISCTECGEFITTLDREMGFESRSYQLHTLSQSLDLLVEMSKFEPAATPSLRSHAIGAAA